MFTAFLQALVATILWSVSNLVYYDLKTRGVRNFTRFAAFWVGTPTTWIQLFVVDEGKPPSFEPEEEARLFADVRRDRARRIGAGDVEPGPIDEQTEPSETG